MKKIISTIALISALFVFTGCQDWETPNPQDTRPTSTGNGSLNGADIPGEGYGNADADGLNARDGKFGDLSNLDYENLDKANVLETVYFGFDQYSIPQEERAKVKAAADAMSANAGMAVLLVAHTDWLGTEEYNLLLSDKRGSSVKEYLGSLGIAADRAEVVARGKQGSTPDVAKNSPEAKNDRRVEIYKVK